MCGAKPGSWFWKYEKPGYSSFGELPYCSQEQQRLFMRKEILEKQL